MKWVLSKFGFGFGKVDEARMLQLLDKNFTEVENRSIYVPLLNKNFVDATTAAVIFQLPDGVTNPDKDYFVKKTDVSANAVTVTPVSGQTIEGAGTYALAAQYKSVWLSFKSGVWYILSAT